MAASPLLRLLLIVGITVCLPAATAVGSVYVEVAQESQAGAGDFDEHVLGIIESYHGRSEGVKAFYNYEASSYNGPAAQPLPSNMSLLFLVENTDGLHLYSVHDTRDDGSGGLAEMQFMLENRHFGEAGSADDPHLNMFSSIFADDPQEVPIVEGGSQPVVKTRHRWMACCTDGTAMGPLKAPWTIYAEFTDVDDDPTTWISHGMHDWYAVGEAGAELLLNMAPDRRVRLRSVSEDRLTDEELIARFEGRMSRLGRAISNKGDYATGLAIFANVSDRTAALPQVQGKLRIAMRRFRLAGPASEKVAEALEANPIAAARLETMKWKLNRPTMAKAKPKAEPAKPAAASEAGEAAPPFDPAAALSEADELREAGKHIEAYRIYKVLGTKHMATDEGMAAIKRVAEYGRDAEFMQTYRAAEAQRRLMEAEHRKAAALLTRARIMAEEGDTEIANEFYRDILKKYPASPAAVEARVALGSE